MTMRPSTRNLLLGTIAVTGIAAAWVSMHGKREPLPTFSATAPAPEVTGTIDVAVQELIDLATSGRRHAAEVAAENLSDSLSPQESRRLLEFSLGPRPAKLDPESWDPVANEIWNVLRCQKTPAPEFAHGLMRFFRDPATSYVLKDYAVQHLGGWLDSSLPAGEGEPNPAVCKEILTFLVGVTAMHGEGYSGTALYALERAIQPGGAAEKLNPQLAAIRTSFVAPLQDAALSLVNDRTASHQAKISAFQIVMSRKELRGLNAARQIATDPSAPPMLRASAIACIGTLGGNADLGLLAAIAKGCSDDRLLCALRPAMDRISKNQLPSGS